MNFLTLLTDELRPIFDESSKIAFSIGNLSVAWYAIIIMSGAIAAALFGYYYYGVRLKIDGDLVCEGVALGIFFGVLGARLYYVAFAGDHYDNFLDMINPRGGGLAIHGVVIALAIYLPIWTKYRHIKLITLLEIAVPLVMFCQAVGRWGNFMNQEAFGSLIKYPGFVDATQKLTDANLLAQREFLSKLFIPKFIIDRMYIPYSSASGFTVAGYYHPTFLYESFFNLIGFIAYMIVRKKWKKVLVGDAISFYLVWYGALRIFIESLRTDPLMLGPFKQAQLISVAMIIIGIVLFVLRRVKKWYMVSSYDALYGEDACLMYPGFEASPKEKTSFFGKKKEENNEKKDQE